MAIYTGIASPCVTASLWAQNERKPIVSARRNVQSARELLGAACPSGRALLNDLERYGLIVDLEFEDRAGHQARMLYRAGTYRENFATLPKNVRS
jgi:hypothetical protein